MVGFLAGIAYRFLGIVCLWRNGKSMEVWTYWTDKTLRRESAGVEQKIKLRDAISLSEISEESVTEHAVEAKLRLSNDVSLKELNVATIKLLTAVMFPIAAIPIAIASAKKADVDNEEQQKQAIEKLKQTRTTCIEVTMPKEGDKILLICLPEIGARILGK